MSTAQIFQPDYTDCENCGTADHNDYDCPCGCHGDEAPSRTRQRNKAIEAAELARWDGQPDRMLAYYHFPSEALPLFGRPRPYRAEFRPCLHSYINQSTPDEPGTALHAYVSTWPGTTIGRITSARVYRHNFGGRFVAITVRGTNGATYHGRASWDHGSCIWLRKGTK